jgi:hypothetical protein
LNLNGNKLRAAAPKLYKASRAALNLLLQDDRIPANVKRSTIETLKSALDAAEDGEAPSYITFVTTHATARKLMKLTANQSNGSAVAKQLYLGLHRGRRDTKQRVYFRLEIDISMLREFRSMLDNADAGGSVRAFERIADQVEKEVLSKSPLKLLADTGI